MRAHISWNVSDKAGAYVWQRRAHACNMHLPNPTWESETGNDLVDLQSREAVENILSYKNDVSLNKTIDSWTEALSFEASAGRFEEALQQVGSILGFESYRLDKHGEGADNIWILTGKEALVIEAKSRKKEDSVFNKDNHGQLLVSGKSFKQRYPNLVYTLISIHPNNKCTRNSQAAGSETMALLMSDIVKIASNAADIAKEIRNTPLSREQAISRCGVLLEERDLTMEKIRAKYLKPFEVEE